MTWNNPNPLANPLNQRMYKCSFNKNCKTLPQPSMTYDQMMQQQDRLHVPLPQMSMRLHDLQSIVDDYSRDKTWDDRSIYSLDTKSLENASGLSKKELEYWNRATIESSKLSSSLSKEWSDVISQFEAQHPSKWEDEVEDTYNIHMKGNV